MYVCVCVQVMEDASGVQVLRRRETQRLCTYICTYIAYVHMYGTMYCPYWVTYSYTHQA